LNTIVGVVTGAFALICWLIVLVTEIRHRDLLGSLLSLFPAAAFVVGWVDARKYNLLTTMVAWTGTFVIGVAFYLMARAGG
jgi:hypothetical protein